MEENTNANDSSFQPMMLKFEMSSTNYETLEVVALHYVLLCI